jgi:prepilin-type N-terminal cleavage/methylation domain-containing protein
MTPPKPRFQRRVSAARLRVRSGFGLIEVMVALIVATIGMMGVAGMLLQIGRRATQMSGQNGRAAVATQTMNRLASLPYDQLSNAAGCTTVTGAPFSYTQCVSVINATGYKSIRLIITPANTRVRADTTYLTRSP